MATPIEYMRNVRVRLIFPETCSPDEHFTGSSWLLVDFSIVKSISDLCEYICNRFSLNQQIRLVLDGSDLPVWEDCHLLRDGDVISVVDLNEKPSFKVNSSIQSKLIEDVAIVKKSKKREFKDDDSEVPVKRQKKEKKHKHDKHKHKKQKKQKKRYSDMSTDSTADESGHDTSENNRKNEKAVQKKDISSKTLEKCQLESGGHSNATDKVDENTTSKDSEVKEIFVPPEVKVSPKRKRKRHRKRTKSNSSFNSEKKSGNQEDSIRNDNHKSSDHVFNNVKKYDDKISKSPNLTVSFHPSTKDYATSTPMVQEGKWSNPFSAQKANHITFDSDSEEETVIYGQEKYNDKKSAPLENVSASAETLLYEPNEAHQLAPPSKISKVLQNSLTRMNGKTPSLSSSTNDTVIVLDSSQNDNTVINISSELEHSMKQGNKSMKQQKKNKVKAAPPLPGQSLVAGATVYSRKRNKKRPFVPLSKEEQLATVNTNNSLILQNANGSNHYCEEINTEAELDNTYRETNTEALPGPKVTKTDYSHFPMLEGFPRAGDKIAYQILEMDKNYSPELSDYKEAIVISYDSISKMVVLQPSWATQVKESGKFDITLEDEGEILTNVANENDEQLTLGWGTMLSVRLLKQ